MRKKTILLAVAILLLVSVGGLWAAKKRITVAVPNVPAAQAQDLFADSETGDKRSEGTFPLACNTLLPKSDQIQQWATTIPC